jgi:VIT1/CCC1 family predicted Fe2+/Mn2+ transporter
MASRYLIERTPMNRLTDQDRKRLLEATKKIHLHKLVQIKGYRILVQRTRDERIRRLLTGIGDEEEKHAEFWSERIEELRGQPEGAAKAYFRDRKVGLMMAILGTKGLFEWAVVGEEEGVEDLSIQAEKIKDMDISQIWVRFASDERMHLERMKTEVLGMETWEIRGGGGVREMIFGANDGFVSTLSFVAGVVGAITNPYIVLLSGVAELFAGTIAMGIGSYQSSRSELEVLERQSRRERIKKGMAPEEETEELIRFYQAEGFKRGEAGAIVERIAQVKELPTQEETLEELGLAPEELGNPVKAGALCGVSFGLAALVPIVPFALPGLATMHALITSIAATVASLFGVGALKTIFSRKNWVRSGLEMTLIGASAAAITYIIGTLFSFIV